jgi:hypothetical protein
MRKKVTIYLKVTLTGILEPVEVEAACIKCACWDRLKISPLNRFAKGTGCCSRFPGTYQKMEQDHCWEFIPAPEVKE